MGLGDSEFRKFGRLLLMGERAQTGMRHDRIGTLFGPFATAFATGL